MENKLDLKGKLVVLEASMKSLNDEYTRTQKGNELEDILHRLNIIADMLKDLVHERYRRGMIKKQDKDHE